MKKEVSKKKIVILSIAVLLVLVLAFLALWFFVLRKDEGPSEKAIFYYPINENENIFENKVYQEYERDLVFGDARETQLFNYERDYDEASAECKFFLDYFRTVIYGKDEEYASFFTEDYFEDKPAPDFTMQMIYEPYVTLNSTGEEEIGGEKLTLYNYYVRYRIFRNNGTFRRGVGSNSALPQIYQLIKSEDGTYRIYRILDITVVNEDE